MNYIIQLNAAFQLIVKDSRLNPTHVSLYMALFQLWNITRFAEVFYVNRQEVMQLSKIGSKSTYHRCLQDLNNWNYIEYLPSHNIYKGSEVRMPIFRTTSGQVKAINETTTGQVLVSNTNSIKHKVNNSKPMLPKNKNEVLDFFKKQEWPSMEAKKFFNHYNSIGWKIGGKIKIIDWHSTAENWILKAQEIKANRENSKTKKPTQTKDEDFLKINKEKNYSEPL